MNLRVTRAEIAVGAFLLLAFAGLVALFVGRGGVASISAPMWRVRARFGRVTGVHPGSAVRMSGIDIGSVETVRLTEEGRVEVVMALRKEYAGWVRQTRESGDLATKPRDLSDAEIAKLRAAQNSIVRIESSPLGTGDSALAITPGGRDLPAADEESLLAAEPESSAITDAFEKLKKLIADILGPEGGQPGGSVGAILQDNGKMAKQLNDILARIEALLEKSQQSSVGRLLADEGKLYDEVHGTVKQARDTIADMDQAVRKTAESADATLKNVNEALAEVKADLRRTTDELNRALREASDLVASVREKGLLAAADGPGGALAKRVDAILAEVEKAVADVKAATAKLPALADEGNRLLGSGSRVAGEAEDLAGGAKRHWLLRGLFEAEKDEWIRAWDTGPEKK